MKNKRLIILILALQFLSVFSYAQSAPQQTKEEKKKAEQERKAQETQAKEQQKQQQKQAKADAKAAKRSAPVEFQGGYDRFTNVTTTGFQVPTSEQDEVFAGRKIDIGVGASYKGTTVPQDSNDINIRLFIAYTIRANSTARDHSLILLVDNEPMDFGQLSITTRETYGSSVRFTHAVVVTEVSYATLLRLANARTIEGRFSGVEFQLSPKFIPTMRAFLHL
jgi:Ni/Co efflux regulator RcnB